MTGASPAVGRLRVVTWNIRAAIGPGEPFPPAWWRYVDAARLQRIGEIITDFDADIVTLQEVSVLTPHGTLVDQPAELAHLTGMHVRYAAAHAYPLVEPEGGQTIGVATWGNAILTRAPLGAGFAQGLPRAADDDLVEPAGFDHPLAGVRYVDTDPGHREPRCLVGGTIGKVTVATTHLTYIGRDQRRAQAEAVADRLHGTTGPVILTGDFNAAVDAPELASLGVGFEDAFAAVGMTLVDPCRRSCGPWPIDHVRVRGLAVTACRVATDGGDASDHWPVVVDLERPE